MKELFTADNGIKIVKLNTGAVFITDAKGETQGHGLDYTGTYPVVNRDNSWFVPGIQGDLAEVPHTLALQFAAEYGNPLEVQDSYGNLIARTVLELRPDPTFQVKVTGRYLGEFAALNDEDKYCEIEDLVERAGGELFDVRVWIKPNDTHVVQAANAEAARKQVEAKYPSAELTITVKEMSAALAAA